MDSSIFGAWRHPGAQTLPALELTLAIQLAGLAAAAAADPYLSKRRRRILLFSAALLFLLSLSGRLGLALWERGGPVTVRVLLAAFAFSVRPAAAALLLQILRPGWKRWIPVGANALLSLSSLWSGLCFRIDAQGVFLPGPLAPLGHALSCVFLVLWLVQAIRDTHRGKTLLIPVSVCAVLMAAAVWDALTLTDAGIGCLTAALVSGFVFAYLWLHMQSAWEYEQALMAEQRIQIMISQIQPHFLYNTLSTIQALCRIDPEKAFDTVERFGAYLRQNIDSLSQASLIPFEKELDHTRTYAEIEMLRFPSIHLEYDIEDSDFFLPALTVQPMVENAIRHGVRIRSHGQVAVRTRREKDAHVITIWDNGKGFDKETVNLEEGSHIGIRNVRERVEKLCGGTLTIDSRIGEGTMVTIRIPFGKEHV